MTSKAAERSSTARMETLSGSMCRMMLTENVVLFQTSKKLGKDYFWMILDREA